MSTRLNLINQRFGNLVVTELSESYISPRGCRRSRWKCICDCGNTKIVNSRELLLGKTKSCGCAKFSEKDITGTIFGKLKVLKMDVPYIDKRGRSQTRWKCQCSCGNITVATSSALRSGKHRSCGCNSIESLVAIQLKKYLQSKYNAIPEYRVGGSGLQHTPYDIYIPKYKAFVEVQGLHHYDPNNWFNKNKGYSHRVRIDTLKRNFANNHGIFIEIDLRIIKTLQQAISYVDGFIFN